MNYSKESELLLASIAQHWFVWASTRSNTWPCRAGSPWFRYCALFHLRKPRSKWAACHRGHRPCELFILFNEWLIIEDGEDNPNRTDLPMIGEKHSSESEDWLFQGESFRVNKARYQLSNCIWLDILGVDHIKVHWDGADFEINRHDGF